MQENDQNNRRINWYPGHMAKTRRLLQDQLRVVDAVIELCDARAPQATRNADLEKLTRDKARILILNKADMANDAETARWANYYRAHGYTAIRFNSNGGKIRDIMAAIEDATRPAVERAQARGLKKTIRLMVLGIPNVGKSTFINRLYGKGIVQASDRPGVTRSNRWVKLNPYLELMDTPGMLPPRLDDQESARMLAYLGSIKDQIMDTEELAGQLLLHLLEIAPEATYARFKLPAEIPGDTDILNILELACKGRGWLLSGGRFDTERAAALILDEFRAGKVGKITIEPLKG